jgi:hypothetical protein
MLVLTQNPKVGMGIQKLHDIGKMLIESISIALNQDSIYPDYDYVN